MNTNNNKMIAEQMEHLSPMYSAWLGKSVVLVISIRQCHVPLHCSIVSESDADVRIRLEPGWELDVRKELVLAVEEDTAALDNQIN